MTAEGNPPPGWHKDPYNPDTHLRWWDGSTWSDNISPITTPTDTSSTYSSQPQSLPPSFSSPYPDSSNTGYTQNANVQSPYVQSPYVQSPYVAPGVGNARGGAPLPRNNYAGGSSSVFSSNHYSVLAFIFAGVYMLLAITTHFIILGIIPLAMSIRAMASSEKLAPFALGCSILVFIINFLVFTGKL